MTSGFEALREAYLSWPSLAREGLEEGATAAERASSSYGCVEEVVVCGVGGSGVVGEYLSRLSEVYGGVPVYTARSLQPPRFTGRRTLVLGVSFSGATVETIRCVEGAAQGGARVAVVSGKGPLLERAEAHGWVTMRVAKGPAARSMFASLFYTALGFLAKLGLLLVPRSDVEASITALARGGVEDEAARLAEQLLGSRLVVIAAGWELAPVAVRAHQELAENSKKASIVAYSPESLHNLIEGLRSLEGLGNTAALLLRWRGYTARPLYEYLEEVVSSVAPKRAVVELGEPGLLAAMMRATLLVGLASIHLARLEGIDPAEIPRIKEARRRASGL